MPRWSRLTIAAVVGSLLVAGRGSIGRLLRRVDQRAGVFAPRGAWVYNEIAPAILRPFYRRVANDVVTELARGRKPGFSSVLELGSGPGELAIEIAHRLPGGEVVGIDLAQAMIDRAVERTRAVGLDGRVRFQLADAAALPHAATSFDLVVSTLSLHHWSSPAAVFAEIGRVLRPGGVALIHDLRPFAYTRNEIEAFLAGGPLAGATVQREPNPGLLGVFFVRIRLDPAGSSER